MSSSSVIVIATAAGFSVPRSDRFRPISFRCLREPWSAPSFFCLPLSPGEGPAWDYRTAIFWRRRSRLIQTRPSGPANFPEHTPNPSAEADGRERPFAEPEILARFPHPRISRRDRLPCPTDGRSHRSLPFEKIPPSPRIKRPNVLGRPSRRLGRTPEIGLAVPRREPRNENAGGRYRRRPRQDAAGNIWLAFWLVGFNLFVFSIVGIVPFPARESNDKSGRNKKPSGLGISRRCYRIRVRSDLKYLLLGGSSPIRKRAAGASEYIPSIESARDRLSERDRVVGFKKG